MFVDKSINAGLYKSLVFACILSATIRFTHTAGATDENWTLLHCWNTRQYTWYKMYV